MFQGRSGLALDAKGRMSVPARHRDALTLQCEGRLTLTRHPDGCLLLYPAPAWEPVRAQVMAFPSTNQQASLWKRLLIGFAEELAPDGAGRLLISPELRTYARIDKRVMCVGQGSHFEIWDLAGWNEQLERLRSGGNPTLPPGMENFSL